LIGWDEGIVGMQVGGERKLTVPPNMAYGKEGSGPIPKNTTITFGTWIPFVGRTFLIKILIECKLMEIK
jgi:FKBP-type peptidyl-prolyl cis-trans isomerase 2